MGPENRLLRYGIGSAAIPDSRRRAALPPSSSQITGARLPGRDRGDMPNTCVILRQSSTEFSGRLAGVGYSSVVTASTRGLDAAGQAPSRVAVSMISSAKPCQLTAPAPVK